MISPSIRQGVTILIVADDTETAEALSGLLESGGYQVGRVSTAAEAKSAVQDSPPDLIILDLTLPDADGLVLCADLKARTEAPIIIVSESTESRDRVLAFKLGADDYVGKPFNPDELEARVEALLRRSARVPAGYRAPQAPPPEQQRVGELVVDHSRRRVALGGEALHLTPTEYRLLRALASRPDEVLSREELAHQVWGYGDASVGRAMDLHIHRLRAKLEKANARAPSIIAVRGFGYKLSPEARDRSAA
ncbi:MAG: response regulator transcription factor [Chloroflexi bacterium]|nr:response regulator transcription factor [Chloroflexota bacterium]